MSTWIRGLPITVEWKGDRRKLVDLCREMGMDYDVARARIRTLGWGVEQALSTPIAERSSDPRRCVRGHLWDKFSTRMTRDGYRSCKICAALR